jgi:hypothetical protein
MNLAVDVHAHMLNKGWRSPLRQHRAPGCRVKSTRGASTAAISNLS